MAHHVFTIANYLLSKAQTEGLALTSLQLLKLTYLAQGYMLGATNRPLFNQEIQAWKHGPVVKELYHAIKQFGDKPITTFLPEQPDTQLSQEESDLIDVVFREFSNKDGLYLSSLTHEEDSPWDLTWRIRGMNGPIPNELLQIYYNGKIERT